jgi:hypothetical protein
MEIKTNIRHTRTEYRPAMVNDETCEMRVATVVYAAHLDILPYQSGESDLPMILVRWTKESETVDTLETPTF